MTRLVPFALLALALFLAPACSSTPEIEERWRSIEVRAASDRLVWQIAMLSLQNLGFPKGPASSSGSSAREIESGWKTILQPFRGEGYRTRAHVRMTPLAPGNWKLEARVKREFNQNLVSPLDPTRAEWEPAADDDATAQVLLMHVRMRLDPDKAGADEAKEAPKSRDG